MRNQDSSNLPRMCPLIGVCLRWHLQESFHNGATTFFPSSLPSALLLPSVLPMPPLLHLYQASGRTKFGELELGRNVKKGTEGEDPPQ